MLCSYCRVSKKAAVFFVTLLFSLRLIAQTVNTGPTITSFTPGLGGLGTKVVITGTNLDKVTGITFGDHSITRQKFTIVSPDTVIVVVGTGSSGPIKAMTVTDTFTTTNTFGFVAPPVINRVGATSGTTYNVIDIYGSNFSNVSAVTFGGVPADGFYAYTPTQIKASVADGASGQIVVTTPGGVVTYNGFTFVPPAPTISATTPESAKKGGTITINGTYLNRVTSVSFGGVPATSFTINSPSSITAVVGDGNTGDVVVKTATGDSASTWNFTYIPTPVTVDPTLWGFAPSSGGKGVWITLYGDNLIEATGMTVGGSPVRGFRVINNTSVTGQLLDGASGAVKVTTPRGVFTDANTFTYTTANPPVITSFAPKQAIAGASVTISGTSLFSITDVKIGGVSAVFSTPSATSIVATVPEGAIGNTVVLDGLMGGGTLTGWTYMPTPTAPIITSFSPRYGTTGDMITIDGTNLSQVTTVRAGGAPVSYFKIQSPTRIIAILGGGNTGDITVESAAGRTSVSGFEYIRAVQVPGAENPDRFFSSLPGEKLTITGYGFESVTGVTVSGIPVTSLLINNSGTITIGMPPAPRGPIIVSNTVGSGRMGNYIGLPVLSSFAPLSASIGDSVELTGLNFSEVTEVTFGGKAAGFRMVTPTLIRARVETGASGEVKIASSWYGTASLPGFKVNPPVVHNFSPASAEKNDTVLISGKDFAMATAVSFGGKNAKSFILESGDLIRAVVGEGASGNVVVTTPFGTSALGGFTYLIPDTIPPTILSIVPVSGPAGSEITVYGSKFDPVPENNTVYFGAVKGTVVSATTAELKVIVPASATYAPLTVTTGDKMTAYSSQVFTVAFKGDEGITPTSFAPASVYYTGATKYEGGWDGIPLLQDLDGDQKIDIAVPLRYNQRDIMVFRNTSNNGELSMELSGIATNTPLFALGRDDYDGDGKMDILGTTDLDIFGVNVLKNHSTKDFISFEALPNIPTVSLAGYSITSGDFGGDGKPDLAFASRFSRVSFQKNLTSHRGIAFDPKQYDIIYPMTFSSPVSIDARDLDGDGKMDLAVALARSSYLSSENHLGIVKNTSVNNSISFAPSLYYDPPAGASEMKQVIIADLDNDGRPDVISSNGAGVYKNTTANGTLSFAAPVVLLPGVNATSIAAGDIDGDGLTDIVLTNTAANLIYAFRNTSSGGNISFSGRIDLATSKTPMSIKLADLNGDGKPDLFYTNSSDSIYIMLNQINKADVPVISGFTPDAAAQGGTVVITGNKLINTTAVSFGGTPAASFEVISDTEIHAVLNEGTSGIVSVTTTGGTTTKDGFLFIDAAPVISSFSPASGRDGTTVKISGTGFVGVTGVSFGDVYVSSFTVVSSKEIRAVVSTGYTGAVKVITDKGTASRDGFTYLNFPPVIASIDKTKGTTGDIIKISGSNFTGATSVTLGGVAAPTFTVDDDRTITVKVGAGGRGDIRVVTPSGTAVYNPFYFYTVPVIYAVMPLSASNGDTINIIGKNLSEVYNVSLGTLPRFPVPSFTIVSDTLIQAIVGVGGSGDVVVTSYDSAATYPGFVYTTGGPAIIESFYPDAAVQGQEVTIWGTNLTYTTDVKFGGVSASSFQVMDDSWMVAVVGPGNSGDVTVINDKGPGSMAGFTFIAPPDPVPEIFSFAPTSAKQGETVRIRGVALSAIEIVLFGGLPAQSFTISGDTLITAIVGNGNSGNVMVAIGTEASSLPGFTYIPPMPVLIPEIYSFTPSTGKTGDVITISGKNFSKISDVTFGGTAATSFIIKSDNIITAVIGNGTTGFVRVEGTDGSSYIPGFVFTTQHIDSSLALYDFSPASGKTGDVITIRGKYLNKATAVSFGGTAASSFIVKSDSVITAVIGNGSTGDVKVNDASLSGFTYISNTPELFNFYPSSGKTGEVITIRGKYLNKATAVSFGGTAVTSFIVKSDSVITAVVGNGSTGDVKVNDASLSGFTYISNTPDLFNFYPSSGKTGDVISIRGKNLSTASHVTLGGVSASFIITSDSTILATVGSGHSGGVTVITTEGTAYLPGFEFVEEPVIRIILDHFTPASGEEGTLVTIYGKNLSGTASVSFGGVPAKSFSVTSDSTIIAVVGAGNSGDVKVDTVSIAGFTYIQAPVINTITLYPNPSAGTVAIKHPVSANAKIRVVDLMGNLLRLINVDPNSGQTSIQLSDLQTGYYKVTWSNGSDSKTSTIVIQH